MKAYRPPMPDTLPGLPRGCDELRATAPPDADTRLDDHLDCLPGLGGTHASYSPN